MKTPILTEVIDGARVSLLRAEAERRREENARAAQFLADLRAGNPEARKQLKQTINDLDRRW